MYTTSHLWDTIMESGKARYEMSLVIGETGRLILKSGDVLTFGGVSILVGQSTADAGYKDARIVSMNTSLTMFGSNHPSVGSCLAGQLSVTMLRPLGDIPRMALVRPYVRVTNGTQTSEWIPQGIFYIDTREYSQNDDGIHLMTLHCYDAMLKTEAIYPSVSHSWPMSDADVVNEIAATIGVRVDERTWDIITEGYQISAPLGYTMREVLGHIGAMYAGNWVMNYDGELLLIALNGIPPETNFLVNEGGFVITFGGDKILV